MCALCLPRASALPRRGPGASSRTVPGTTAASVSPSGASRVPEGLTDRGLSPGGQVALSEPQGWSSSLAIVLRPDTLERKPPCGIMQVGRTGGRPEVRTHPRNE